MISFQMTKAQKEIAHWAINAMHDRAQDDDLKDVGYTNYQIPVIHRRWIRFPDTSLSVIDELLYYLEQQYPSMIDDYGVWWLFEGTSKQPSSRPSRNLARKIRKIVRKDE